MDPPTTTFAALPSDILIMIVKNIDDLLTLQSFMLASSHTWRHAGSNVVWRQRWNEFTTFGRMHRSICVYIRMVAQLRYVPKQLSRNSSLTNSLDSYLSAYQFLPGYWTYRTPGPTDLLMELEPMQARSMITTASAIYDTARKCLAHYMDTFVNVQPIRVIGPVEFDIYSDQLTDLPDLPRYTIGNAGSLTCTEQQRVILGFWMIHYYRVFSRAVQHKPFDWSPADLERAANLTANDLHQFQRAGTLSAGLFRFRPRDYLFNEYHLFMSAEEYLQAGVQQSVRTAQYQYDTWRPNPISEELCEPVTPQMEHFVRLFKEIRSHKDGDGYYPWRRLGFAIWDEARLKKAGLLEGKGTKLLSADRVRWLSVIRDEDYHLVQQHRLTMHDSDREDDPQYEYPSDSEWSASILQW